MGNWGNVVYIHSADKQKILSAINSIFESENRTQINKPAERVLPNNYDEPMQYGSSEQCSLWGIVLIEGEHDWTAMQTAPLELFCEKNSTTNNFRLAELAQLLNTECVYFGLYDSSFTILAEALPTGEYAVSGFNDDRRHDPLNFHGFQIEEQNFITHFQLLRQESLSETKVDSLDFQESFLKLFNTDFSDTENDFESGETTAAAIGKVLCGSNFEHWHNSLNIEYLIPHKELQNAHYHESYFQKK